MVMMEEPLGDGDIHGTTGKSKGICKRKDERQNRKEINLIRQNREEQTDTPYDISYTTHTIL